MDPHFRFRSPTWGLLSFDGMVQHVTAYLRAEPDAACRVMVGCDSQNGRDKTVFALVVVVHRVGHGAIFFYAKDIRPRVRAMQPRILTEAALALELAAKVSAALAGLASTENLPPIEVHADVGPDGPTRLLVQDVVGMVRGSGFTARVKPDAPAASHVADLFTKSAVASAHRKRLERREQRYGKAAAG